MALLVVSLLRKSAISLDIAARVSMGKSWAELRLEEHFAWGQPPDGTRDTATEIWIRINDYRGSQKMSAKEQSELTHGMKRLWSENGAYQSGGVLVIDIDGSAVKVNADSGKNRGWLLPQQPGGAGGQLSADLSEQSPTGDNNDA